ncbi:MAG TPA: META domain-containing protein [Chitinophagaceae bacterium]|jgi:heat shock protein HslJ|nr:META domain-containing protein [Chitinophagaceae bacterium]
MCKLLLTAFLITFISCNRYNAQWAPDHYWAAKTWELKKMKGEKSDMKNVALQFDWAGKKFRSSCGCNEIDGKYELIDKKNIRFASLSSTGNCTSMPFEKEFIETLKKVDSYEIEGDNMLLKSDKKVVMIFSGKEIPAVARK